MSRSGRVELRPERLSGSLGGDATMMHGSRGRRVAFSPRLRAAPVKVEAERPVNEQPTRRDHAIPDTQEGLDRLPVGIAAAISQMVGSLPYVFTPTIA
jgi:hypothetical protein